MYCESGDWQQSPEFRRLSQAGWSLMYIEEEGALVGGADQPAGHYAVFRRQRTGTP